MSSQSEQDLRGKNDNQWPCRQATTWHPLMRMLPNLVKCKPKPLWLLVVLATLLLFFVAPVWQSLEQNLGLYSLFHLRGPLPPPPDFLVIKLNSTAASQLGVSRQSVKWPRHLHAQLIDKLTAVGARWIVFDIAFKEPNESTDDQRLADAITRANRVVLFHYLKRYQMPAGQGTLDVEEIISPFPLLADSAKASAGFVLPKVPAQVSHVDLYSTMNAERQASQPLQIVLLQYEPLWREFIQQLRADFPEASSNDVQATYDILTTHPAWFEQFTKTHSGGSWPVLLQAVSHTQSYYVNFYGPEGTLRSINIDQALTASDAELASYAANKIVYVGYSEALQTEQVDAHRTVFSRNSGVDISGVEISATVAANLFQRQGLNPLSPIEYMLVMLLLSLGGLLSLRYCTRGPALIFQLLFLAGYLVVWYAAFAVYYLWLPVVAPIALLLWINGWAVFYRFEQTRLRAAHIQQALSQYLPPEAASRVSGSISQFATQHQIVSGVCMLTDIVGYTRLSETLDPQDLHILMNRYYGELIDEVKKSGGIIANIVGDAMLALWLGESVTPELCRKASGTAKAIQQRLQQLDALNQQLPTRFALHAGEFSLGNLGAAGHFEYSPVGDIINTSARIEPFNRTLGTHMLCSAKVAAALQASGEVLRYLGKFAMRNKSEPFALYSLCSPLTGVTSATESLECVFAQALNDFEERKLQKAMSLFQNILMEAPQDGPSRYYLEQCKRLLHETGNG